MRKLWCTGLCLVWAAGLRAVDPAGLWVGHAKEASRAVTSIDARGVRTAKSEFAWDDEGANRWEIRGDLAALRGRAVFSPLGEVRVACVDESVPAGVRASLYEVLQGWRFHGPQKEGRAVWTRIDIPFRFPARSRVEREMSEVEHAPRYLRSPEGAYPLWGSLLVEFSVDRQGRAGDLVVLFAEDKKRAAEELLDLASARFTPAKVDGEAVPCRWRYNYDEH